jgi:hypothetical protein
MTHFHLKMYPIYGNISMIRQHPESGEVIKKKLPCRRMTISRCPVHGRNQSENLAEANSHHGERGSASLYGGLGAWPPVGSRGKAPGGGQGALPPEVDEIKGN